MLAACHRGLPANVKNATLRQLKTFVTVARRLSFSRAAEELYLSQPAVSEQIKQLEVHLGVPLFEKLGKKVFLTPAGEEMLRHSHEIIDRFRRAEEAMERFREPLSPRLRVGMITAGSYLFPHLLAAFMQRFGSVELDVAVQNRQELLQRVDDNVTDIVVMVGVPGGPLIGSTSFAPHPFVIVAAPDHPLAGRRRIPLAALAQERFLVREKGSDTWHSMKEHFIGRISKLRAPLEIRSTEAIKQGVIAGLGVSFLSAYTIGVEVQARKLVVLDVEGFPIVDSWQVVHRADKQLAPAALAFKQFLLEEGARQIARLADVAAWSEAVPPVARRARREPG
jgi:DNA-binding transcriptional LysR family regulator